MAATSPGATVVIVGRVRRDAADARLAERGGQLRANRAAGIDGGVQVDVEVVRILHERGSGRRSRSACSR